jgi:hypothetical protein
MARATKQVPGTEVVDWEKEMEAQAKVAAGVVANIGGNVPRFSIRGGTLSIDDQPIPGNHMAVVILDALLENAFYEGEWDPNNVVPPTCFAFGRDASAMAPHEVVVEKGQAQSEKCNGCPMNVFGTADRGKGKACKNRVKLMVVKAGDLSPEGRFTYNAEDYGEDHFQSAPAALFSVPPTSIGAFASYVKTVANTLRIPPHGIFTKISVRPDPKVQVRVIFEAIEVVSKKNKALLPILMRRNKEVAPIIEQPYNLDVEEQTPAQPARGKPRPAVKKGKY